MTRKALSIVNEYGINARELSVLPLFWLNKKAFSR